MSVLKSLKLTDAVPAAAADAKQSARGKLLRFLEEQKAVVQADIDGRAYNATRTVFRKDENGQRIRVEAPRHVRRGWIADASGKVFFQARYGSKPLDLGKGMTAVEVDKLAALPDVIEKLIEATNSGELDQALATAAAERKANFRKRDKAS